MNRRLLAAVSGSVLLVATFVPASSLAAGPTTRTERVALGKIDPAFRPFLADAGRKVTVVLELAGDPALGPGGRSRAEQRTRAGTLRAVQDRLGARIRATGGKVTGRYQYAYNGIRVRTAGARLADLAALPGVVAVRPLRTYSIENANAVPYVGAPAAWQDAGATGAGVKIAVIDSGIDYTHADFGGPGTPGAYAANDPTTIEPGTFPTAKVVAGWDFAGNDYDASGDVGSTTPEPDPDPLDCGSHGSHVSGTAAGEGVLTDHSTYAGPYDASLHADDGTFTVAPGVAPEASLVALKVFGCEGSTDLVVDALEWVAAYNASHADAVDVVNISLGAPFGDASDPDAVATDALVRAGVVVVASAGNESAVPYITGSPAAARRAISVAALDAFPAIPMAVVDLPGTGDVHGNNQNASPDLPVTGMLHVVAGPSSGLSLGCTAAEYDAPTAGRIAVVRRGDCAFVDKGAAAMAAGAIGVIVVNHTDTGDDELPTFVGYNPELFTIPMIGVSNTAVAALTVADGEAVTLRPDGVEPNPTYREIADFSSSGPRWGDGWLKPDVAAPGVNLLSALNGSGWNGTTYSGTSMAAPVTSGVAALVREVHPGWSPLRVKAAIANTADASTGIVGYDPLRAGAGVVRADRAVTATVLATTSDGTASLSFGYEAMDGDWSEGKWLTLSNTGDRAVRYNLAASTDLVSVRPSNVRVGAHGAVSVFVRASLTRSQVAALPSADAFLTGAFGELDSLAGVVTASPSTSVAGAQVLRIPYLLVPRGLSEVEAEPSAAGHGRDVRGGSMGTASLRVRNRGVHDGMADVYALGLLDGRGDGSRGTDVRAVGVQVLPGAAAGAPADDRLLQFVVNMHDRFSTAAPHEIDIAVDTNGDGAPDYLVVGIDNGLVTTGAYNGIYLSVILDASTFAVVDAWLADAPLNGSTVILPALASDLGLTEGDGGFTYRAAALDGLTGLVDEAAGTAAFDAYSPAQSTGAFVPVPARSRATIPAWVRSGTRVLGWLVVSLDDANGGSQADVVRARSSRH